MGGDLIGGARQLVKHGIECPRENAHIAVGLVYGDAGIQIPTLDGANRCQKPGERRECRPQQQEVDQKAQDGGEDNKGCIDDIVVGSWVMLGNPPPGKRVQNNDDAVGDDDFLKDREPVQPAGETAGMLNERSLRALSWGNDAPEREGAGEEDVRDLCDMSIGVRSSASLFGVRSLPLMVRWCRYWARRRG